MTLRHPGSQPGRLWAITSFFNPAGYRQRLINYRRFRAALTVPLATIELGFNGHFELQTHDADKLLRVTDGDIMWQKERLLNILVTQLPPDCEYVAWIDSDVLFQDPQWPQQAIEHLATAPLVQLFSKVRYLERDESNIAATLCVPSMAAEVLEGSSASAVIGRVMDRSGGAPSGGMAWAARRKLLQDNGFYDGCVIGGGDTALVCAAYGVPEVVMELHHMNAMQRVRYSRWADRFHIDVKASVSALAGEIHHMWHGDLDDRRARLRHTDLLPHDFDPHHDIRLGADGPLRWATDKVDLHNLLRDYFRNRREDGKQPNATAIGQVSSV